MDGSYNSRVFFFFGEGVNNLADEFENKRNTLKNSWEYNLKRQNGLGRIREKIGMDLKNSEVQQDLDIVAVE
jgi:hypothetical protein